MRRRTGHIAAGAASESSPAGAGATSRDGTEDTSSDADGPLVRGGGRADLGSTHSPTDIGGGTTALGKLAYRGNYLLGSAAIRRAFPRQVQAASDEGGSAKQAVQLFARLPGGQLRGYDVNLLRSGGRYAITRTRLLARDLELRQGDQVALALLPDGRPVVAAAGPAPAPEPAFVRFSKGTCSGIFSGTRALTMTFPSQAQAARQSLTTQPVRLYARPPGGELQPYDLSLYPCSSSNRVVAFKLCRVSRIVNDLGLRHGDEARLSVQPDGRVVLEPRPVVPASPIYPVEPIGVVLTKAFIKLGQVRVPVYIVSRLLGEERARHGPGPGGIPVKLSSDGEVQVRLVAYKSKSGQTMWCLTRLGRWLRACGASPGDTLRLEVEAGAAEALPAVTEAAPAAATAEACARRLVARLVRAGPAAAPGEQ